MQFVIVTGLSGAGKTTSLKMLENMGFFCVDNLPSILLSKFADLCFQTNTEFTKVAVGIDARGRKFFRDFEAALEYMESNNYPVEVLYLHCEKDALVNRYNFTRHVHPLADDCGTILECIEKENEILKPIKNHATYLIDTTKMQPKNIKHALERLYATNNSTAVRTLISSFGFKRGLPVDADFVFDARFLPNPYNVAELRSHSGLEECVQQYLLNFDEFNRAVNLVYSQLKEIIPAYSNSGKHELFYAIGCTGGYHRSVFLAQSVAQRLAQDGFDVSCEHRDLELEGEKWKNLSQQ
ncbi:MAG: RNase adapter RapZ [Clostridia bacterium]|nr:RNase adapter RapZ [Clostridia bacterium]